VIFNLYPRVAVKVGEERYVFDRDELMFTEVVEIEKATGLSFGEWQQELSRYSIMALGGLLHMLRKRAGVPSDFETMNFAAYDIDVVPLHDDGSEFTAEDVAADISRRLEEAKQAVPTIAAAGPGSAANPAPVTTAPISRTSLNITESGRGNGNGSRGASSRSSAKRLTPR
jgi:hypothetical protein